jgi:hypothetical protein
MAIGQENKNELGQKKIPLIFDVDDVVLNSKKRIIEIINKKYNLSPQIEEENERDWDFTYSKRTVKRQRGVELYNSDFLELFETKEFWEGVEINKSFLDILSNEQIRNNYKITLVSVGTNNNLKMKEEYLYKHIDMTDITFLGIPVVSGKYCDKRALNDLPEIYQGIQVDDNYDCLNTNEKLKILLKNNKDTTYNEILDIREDLYVINDLSELEDLLLFISDANNDFFCG